MHFRILKMIATSDFLTALECTKFDFGRGFAPDPAGGAYSALPDSLAGLRGPSSKGKGGTGNGGMEEKRWDACESGGRGGEERREGRAEK